MLRHISRKAVFKRISFGSGFRVLFWTLQIVSLIALAKTSIAMEEAPSEPAPAAESPTIPEPQRLDDFPKEKTNKIAKAVDTTHASLERNILEKVIHFDDFFGNTKGETERQTGYMLRWRNSVLVEEGGHVRFGTNAHASIVLSKINERLRLTFSEEDDTSKFSQELPEDAGNPGFDRTTHNVRLVNTELRYSLLKTPTWDIFLGAGVRLVIPPEAFARSRIQYTYTFSDISLIRIRETPFINSANGPGQTTEIELEQLLDRGTILRFDNSGTVSQNIRGLEWGTELSLMHDLSPHSAITLLGGTYGNTSVADWVTDYRVLTRYRSSFLRSWLFYELEPGVSWPRGVDGNFRAKFAVTFRLEVVFQGTGIGNGVK